MCNLLLIDLCAYAPLTSSSCVHSNVYGLINTCCIRYLTIEDSSQSTSPPVQTHHARTSVSIELPPITIVDNSSTIRVVPVTQDTSTWNLVTCTACCVVSYAEQGSITIFTNVLQSNKTVVLVCCTSE